MSSAAQALTSVASGKKIIRPGASLSVAARPLEDPARLEGKFPNQWEFPGPNSEWAAPNGQVVIPAIVSPASSAQATIFTYQVPEGFKYMMRGLAFGYIGTDWSIGSPLLAWTLELTQAAGPRNVEFLQNQSIPWGSQERFWPFSRAVEFDPLDVLAMILNNTGIATPSANSYAWARLDGYVFPNAEIRG